MGKITEKPTSDEKYRAYRKAYSKTLENELLKIARELKKCEKL